MAVAVFAAVAGLVGALRRVGDFQRLDLSVIATPAGPMIVAVEPHSGAARAGLGWGDVIVAVEGNLVERAGDLERTLLARRVSGLTVSRQGVVREISYYAPAPRIDVQYLLVAFATMFTLVVAVLVYLSRPAPHAGRFLALASSLFVTVVIPFPTSGDALGQVLLLIRDFGRLALPPLLALFFASFPIEVRLGAWRIAVFIPSCLVAVARTAMALGFLSPVFGGVMVAESLDRTTVALVVAGIVAAAGLGVRSYIANRGDPTRRRQVEWVALGAAAGFTPYLLLSLVPQLAGAETEVLGWISLLPLTLVPLGVAGSILEFRLWDLEDISRQVIANGVAVLLGGVSFAALNYGLTQFGFRLGNWRNLAAVGGGVLLAAATVPARRILLEGLERLQYRERLAARRALTTFAEEAVAHRDPAELLGRLTDLLHDALGVDRVLAYAASGERLAPVGENRQWPDLRPEDVRGSFPSEGELMLRAAGFWHRFPLERDGRTVGVVYCGRRSGEIPLGHGERRLVGALAAQAALALENTLLLADLRRQVEEHRLLENYLERVFQSSAAALLICDGRGRVLRSNQRACTLLGRTSDGLLGTALRSFVSVPVEWGDLLPTDVEGLPVRFLVHGKERAGLLSTSALETEPGSFDGRIVALDDISEQLRLEQRLAEQERLASLGRLAAGLAHEVNTPVTGIASYAQLLRELTAAGDPRAPLAQKLEEQAFRVARIVTNLLELARPSGFERQVLDLAQVARDEVVQLRAEAEQSGVILEFSAGGEVNTAGNRVQMELVVNNLVRNALQATPKGGRVEVVVAAEPALAVIEVRDSGAGIPEDVRASVFEPFVTTRQGRGGTGVGLAISRDIVRAHGGDIRILAGRAGGTVMRVELPSLEEGA